MCRSYLVLLLVGFTLPSLLPKTRCALTAPFHPYLRRGGLLSAALSLRSPWPDVIRHHASVEPGLSSEDESSAALRLSQCIYRENVEDEQVKGGVGLHVAVLTLPVDVVAVFWLTPQ